jgi:uncharacterized membrane protein
VPPSKPLWISYVRVALRYLLAGTFTILGTMHFVAPAPYLSIMPPFLPQPLALIYISGACEIAGGLGVLFPQPLRQLAARGLILLLIAVFPANIWMLLHGATIGGITCPPFALVSWIRLPFQALFIAWAWYATKPDRIAF